MSEPRPGFQRDVSAVIDAFKAGLVFDPPAMSANEYRESLRMAGMPLTEPDDLEPPIFDFPAPVDDHDEDHDDDPPKED